MPKEETATADANEEPAPESAAKPAKSIKPRPSPKSKSAGKDSGSVKSSD
jgi:hypothetical protein